MRRTGFFGGRVRNLLDHQHGFQSVKGNGGLDDYILEDIAAGSFGDRADRETRGIDSVEARGDDAVAGLDGLLVAHVTEFGREFRPGLAFYVAGADPHAGDRMGRLRLTHAGLRRRDELVLGACREAGIPVVITLGGGYGRSLDDTVEAHCNTVRAARALFDPIPAATIAP